MINDNPSSESSILAASNAACNADLEEEYALLPGIP